MNCVRWSMGDASLHGMGTSSVPGQCFGCYPCPWTKLLPMSPDRTDSALLRQFSSRRVRVGVVVLSCRRRCKAARGRLGSSKDVPDAVSLQQAGEGHQG